MSKKNWSQQITEDQANFIVGMMLYQMSDEDLEKLDRDYPDPEDWTRILLTMALNPKEKWAELGVPEYLQKYEIMDEDEEDE